MKLAAQIPEPALEVLQVERQPPLHAEELEIVAVAPERQDAVALRAEMVVHGRAGAAVAALERGHGADGDGFGSHWQIVGAGFSRLFMPRRSCRSRRSASRSGCRTRSPWSAARCRSRERCPW